jgi:hypothetical protein
LFEGVKEISRRFEAAMRKDPYFPRSERTRSLHEFPLRFRKLVIYITTHEPSTFGKSLANIMVTLSHSTATKSAQDSSQAESIIRKHIRAVSFTPETNFDLGRPQEKYYRGSGPSYSPSYEPGEHAATTTLGLENGSMMNNTSYNWKQLKVMTGSTSMVRAFGQCYDVPDQHEGIAQHHPRYKAIAKLLHKQHAEKPEWLENKLKSADFLLLAIKDDKIVGYSLHETWDIADDEYLDEYDNELREFSDGELGSVDALVEDLEPLNELKDRSVSSKPSDTSDENIDGVSPYWCFQPRTSF